MWQKWGWLYAVIITAGCVFFAFRPSDIQIVTQTTVDTSWKRTLDSQVSSLKISFNNTISNLQKDIKEQNSKISDLKTIQTVIEHYDATTGKLIERMTSSTTEDKSKVTSNTHTSENAGSTITSGNTAQDQTHNVSTDSGSSLATTKTETTTSVRLFSAYAGVGFDTFSGFKFSLVEAGPGINIGKMTIQITESYSWTDDIKWKTHAGIMIRW